MRVRILTITALALVGLSSSASAQGRGTMITADGPVTNFTQTPEWRQAGGNYGVYLQIMERKMMLARRKAMEAESKATQRQFQAMQKQYQAAQKQQAAFQKWVDEQNTKKKQGKPVDPAFQAMLDEEARYRAAAEARAARVSSKKSPRKRPSTAPKSPTGESPADKP